MSKVFSVMFIEDNYTFNDTELRTSSGEKYYSYHIIAETAEEAYHLALLKVREQAKNTVRLNFCKVIAKI